MKDKKSIFIGLLLSLLLLAAYLGLTNGAVKVGFNQLLANPEILKLRLSRILLALIAGSGLAVSGLIFQAILRNPLAEPYVLGVSSGAGLGAIIGLLLGVSLIFLPLIAFIGAATTMLIVYNLAKINGKISSQGLLLSGVITGAIFSSLLLFFISVSTNEGMHSITWWLLGSLQLFDFKLLYIVGVIVSCGIAISLYLARDLNAISLGEEEAHHLGINVNTIRKILFIIASIMTASIVCVCGIIGFIGLIIPHAIRFIFGSDHRTLIPVSAVSSAIFLIIADIISRVMLAPVEIPIGVITSVIGGPVFILLLRKKQKITL
ncbi:MAG: iron ABC transporter permease [Candidatus Omnitrophota bacterium]|jgi:iron complex transport system permease protein|nr:MAG: iron ABC transporter permease [Candidatus Omnitrophota bacterium]